MKHWSRENNYMDVKVNEGQLGGVYLTGTFGYFMLRQASGRRRLRRFIGHLDNILKVSEKKYGKD